MRRKGYDFKAARHLTYRHFDVERDADKCGTYDKDYFERSNHSSHVVIVTQSKCERTGDCKCGNIKADHPEGGFILSTNGRWRCCGFEAAISYDDIQAAPCIPFDAWSRTNMVYGKWRTQTRGRRFWIEFTDLSDEDQKIYRDNWDGLHENSVYPKGASPDDEDVQVSKWFNTYYTCPIYWVEGGWVYTSTIQSHIMPKSLRKKAAA